MTGVVRSGNRVLEGESARLEGASTQSIECVYASRWGPHANLVRHERIGPVGHHSRGYLDFLGMRNDAVLFRAQAVNAYVD